ncbi:aminotransferase class III-fold pyridoxal phosphate-dependent enzyme [Candidatus Woesearchaeota archaeon]|nr:aminotransferase class III-fold pyridoxal phosphate-dependent enzyme [Candidatus Woesearchaeota archaeon]
MGEDKKFSPLGEKSARIIAEIDKYSATNYSPYPFVVEKAEGPWLIDPEGNKALDFLSAYSAILSHRHPGIIKAVEDEMRHGSDLVSRALYSARFAEMVRAVTRLTGYDRVLPKSDGGSAADSAISGLLMHGHERGIKNPEVILTKDYFHGRTWIFASNALFDSDQSFRRLPRAQGIVVVDNTLEAIGKAINKNTVGMFLETHKGEGGPIFSKKEFLVGVKKLCDVHNLFLGLDEIQTGLGRCGYIMAWQEYGEEARPDFVTLGKALGGGIIPVSAVVGTEEFMKVYTPGSDGSTYGGYSIACAAAVAALKYIEEEDIPKKSRELGDYFVQKLRKEIPGIAVENRGLLIRVELKGVKTAEHVCQEMLLGKREPRIFMKHGHYDKEKDVAYTRIAPPPGAMTKELIDLAVENTIAPTLKNLK